MYIQIPEKDKLILEFHNRNGYITLSCYNWYKQEYPDLNIEKMF